MAARRSDSDFSREELAAVSMREGIDRATESLYRRICSSPSARELIERLREPPIPPPAAALSNAKALIVPAALYREYPRIGGDGRTVRRAADSLGLACELIPLASTGGVLENARALGEAIAAEPPGRDLILVSLSKGGADARVAFERGHIPPGRIKAWLQIGGLIHGTPLANRLIEGNLLRRATLKAYLAYTRASRAMVEELGWGEGYPLGPRARAPAGVRVVNLVAFPLRRHLSGALRTRHARLAPLGPNDGATLLLDAVVEPGEILPIWGESHYFQGRDLADLVARLFSHVLKADRTDGASRG